VELDIRSTYEAERGGGWMKKIFTLLVLVSFILSGCGTTKFGLNDNVKIYRVEEERVDQKIAGNQGYITGTPPEIPAGERKTTRTLIRVDVEVPEDLYPLSTVLNIGKDLPGEEGEEQVEVEEEVEEVIK
jgi:hypothetical protein